MDLKSTQLKDTYGNLLTIGTTEGSPTTGTLENGDGEDITSLTLAGDITASKNQNATSSFTFQNTDTTGTNVRTHLNATAGNRSVRLEAIHSDYSYLVSNNARLYLQTNSGSNNPLYLDGDNVIFNGNVGIGTTSPNAPNAKFTVKQSADTSKYHGVSIEANGTDEYLGIGYDGTSFTLSPSYLSAGAFKPLQFHTSNNPRLTIDTSGNVGIGATSVTSNFRTEIAGGDLRVGDTQGEDAVELGWSAGGSQGFVQVYDRGDSAFRNLMLNNSLLIESGGNVGIGETNPTATLNIKSASSNNSDNLAQVLTNSEFRLQYRSDDLSSLYIGGLGSERGYLQGVNNAQDAGVDISLNPYGGNVGIGGSPSTFANYTNVSIKGGSSGSNLDFLNSSGTRVGAIVSNPSTNLIVETNEATPLVFKTNDNPAMTIDSSGNVLVGTTDTAPGVADTNVGVSLNSGRVFASAEGDYALNLNRNTSDGDIVRFRKDGTTVGSIASRGGTTTAFITNPSSGNGAGLTGSTNMLIPSSETGVAVDNRINLGSSGARFKDLYLSGSIYLGGTTSANALDDYEEGTHDTTITCGTSGTITLGGSNEKLQYTKIGRLVTVSGRVAVSGVSSPTGNFTMSLPFTIADLDDESGRSTGGIKIFNTSTNVDNFFFTAHEGNAFITVFKGGSTNGTSDSADTFSGNETIALSVTYVAS